jgi:hypothetical protein
MDDLEKYQPPATLKEKIVYWAFFVLGFAGLGVLLWHFVRVKP